MDESKDAPRLETVSPYGSAKELRTFIEREHQPVDYGLMIKPTTRVLAMGEIHTREIAKTELSNSLEELKALGFTHLAMEMLDSSMQEVIDNYQKSGGGKNIIVEQLERYGWSAAAASLYLDAVDQATKVGLKVVGIHRPLSPAEEVMNLFLTGDKYGRVPRDLLERDPWMANVVHRVLDENPQNKIVVYAGQMHTMKEGRGLGSLLQSSGTELVSVNIIGGLKAQDDDHYHYTNVEKSVSDAGLDSERFMIPCRAKFPDAAPPVDWFVHLPKVEIETDWEAQVRVRQPRGKQLITSKFDKSENNKN